jgi:hypothetical protein
MLRSSSMRESRNPSQPFTTVGVYVAVERGCS